MWNNRWQSQSKRRPAGFPFKKYINRLSSKGTWSRGSAGSLGLRCSGHTPAQQCWSDAQVESTMCLCSITGALFSFFLLYEAGPIPSLEILILLFEFLIGEENIGTAFYPLCSSSLSIFLLLHPPIHFEEMNAALCVEWGRMFYSCSFIYMIYSVCVCLGNRSPKPS